MPISPENIQALAKAILEDQRFQDVPLACKETRIRSAISRQFYACMHWCRAYCEQKKIEVIRDKNEGSHQALINTFAARHDTNERSVGHCLNTLKEFRVVADYELSESISDIQLNRTLKIADTLKQKLGI